MVDSEIDIAGLSVRLAQGSAIIRRVQQYETISDDMITAAYLLAKGIN